MQCLVVRFLKAINATPTVLNASPALVIFSKATIAQSQLFGLIPMTLDIHSLELFATPHQMVFLTKWALLANWLP